MCRCRSDGPNQECGSGSCGRYRDCCRRLPTETTSFAGSSSKVRGDADYSIRYQINLATLNARRSTAIRRSSDGSQRLCRTTLMKDTLRQGLRRDDHGLFFSRRSAEVQRERWLPEAGAAISRRMSIRKYDFSKKYKVTVNSVAEDWETCRALVAQVVDARPAVRAERHRRQASRPDQPKNWRSRRCRRRGAT